MRKDLYSYIFIYSLSSGKNVLHPLPAWQLWTISEYFALHDASFRPLPATPDDDIWWYLMIYEDIYDDMIYDIWWYMMIYDDTPAAFLFKPAANTGQGKFIYCWTQKWLTEFFLSHKHSTEWKIRWKSISWLYDNVCFLLFERDDRANIYIFISLPNGAERVGVGRCKAETGRLKVTEHPGSYFLEIKA